MTRFYAAQSPRGFSNEINVHRFPSIAARDAWVAEHASDGDVNSATRGAYAVTATEARKLVGYPLNSREARMMMGEPA